MTVRAKALITLLPSEEGGLSHELPCRTQSLVICGCADHDGRELRRPFSATIDADDEEPVAPGDRSHIVTIAVPDDGAAEFLCPGDRFRLWCGHDVGGGIVSRRVI